MRALPLSSSVTDGHLGHQPQLSAWAVRSLIAVPLARAMAHDQYFGSAAGGHLGHPGPVPEYRDT